MNEDQKRLGNISLAIVTCLVVTVTILMLIVSCSYMQEHPDSLPEQLVEEVIDDAIEYETGYKPHIDLTPSVEDGHYEAQD